MLSPEWKAIESQVLSLVITLRICLSLPSPTGGANDRPYGASTPFGCKNDSLLARNVSTRATCSNEDPTAGALLGGAIASSMAAGAVLGGAGVSIPATPCGSAVNLKPAKFFNSFVSSAFSPGNLGASEGGCPVCKGRNAGMVTAGAPREDVGMDGSAGGGAVNTGGASSDVGMDVGIGLLGVTGDRLWKRTEL